MRVMSVTAIFIDASPMGSEVDDLQAAPGFAQMLGGEASMAVVGGRLAAEQHRRPLERGTVERPGDVALPDQGVVADDVLVPTDLLSLVRLSSSGVGASSGSWTYSTSRIERRKYSRSS